MPAPSATRRNVVLLVALLFAQLLLIRGSARGGTGEGLLESWTMGVTTPFVTIAEWIGGGFRSLFDGAVDLIEANRRNTQLESELAELRSEVERSREAALENARLRRLLGMRETNPSEAVAASIVTAKFTGEEMMIVIDRGKQHGVRDDLPVVAWGGAVGRVLAAYERHSKVRLVTDPSAGVGGAIQRSRAQGQVYGRGFSPLLLAYVPRFSDVMLGDRVVTSGADGIFPRGFALGEVREIKESSAGTQTILVTPLIDFRELEEVLVLLESPGAGIVSGTEPVEQP
jgi:rod shape-determining protein MreC